MRALAVCVIALIGGLAVGTMVGLPYDIADDFAARLPGWLFWNGAGPRGGLDGGLRGGLVTGLGAALVLGLVAWLAFGLTRTTDVDRTSSGPHAIWRSDRQGSLVIGLAYGLPLGSAFGLPAALAAGRNDGLVSGLESGFTAGSVGLLFGVSIGLLGGLQERSNKGPTTLPAWLGAALVAQRLARTHGTPRDLVAFLEDAHQRRVLRVVGPVYQFRHATLQDHLAGRTFH